MQMLAKKLAVKFYCIVANLTTAKQLLFNVTLKTFDSI